MMKAVLTLALALTIAEVADAADKLPAAAPDGHVIGPDGKLWRMEGCAAYPVLGAQSVPTPPPADQAAEKPGPPRLSVNVLAKNN